MPERIDLSDRQWDQMDAAWDAFYAEQRAGWKPVENAWCPTGPGGGKDNSCSSSGGQPNAFCPNGPGGGIDPTCSPGSSSKHATASKLHAVKLTGSARKVVEDYQDNSLEINGWLREGIGKAPEEIQRQAIAMKKVFEKHATVLKEDTVLYRGLDAEDLPEGTFTDKAFVSTTTDEEAAAFFGDRVMKITVPKGTKVLAILSGKEQEVILPQWKSFQPTEETGEVKRGDRTSRLQGYVLNEDVWRSIQNAFCPTGPGGGIDPTCSPNSPGIAAGITTEQRARLTPQEKKDFNRYLKQRKEMNKKIKAGTATAEDRAKAEEARKGIAETHRKIKERGEGKTGGGDTDKRKEEEESTPKEPKKRRERGSREVDPEDPQTFRYRDHSRRGAKAGEELDREDFLKRVREVEKDSATRGDTERIGTRMDAAAMWMLEERSVPEGMQSFHHMRKPALMRSATMDGVKVVWEDNFNGLSQAAQTLLNGTFHDKLPEALWKANRQITLTSQASSRDRELSRKFGRGVRAVASGGDGNIVAYRGQPMTIDTFAHEAGHNLAKKEWDSVSPEPSSPYGKAQRVEKPLTAYGATAVYEDFAEAVKLYVTDEERVKREAPLKHAAIKDLLKKWK